MRPHAIKTHINQIKRLYFSSATSAKIISVSNLGVQLNCEDRLLTEGEQPLSAQPKNQVKNCLHRFTHLKKQTKLGEDMAVHLLLIWRLTQSVEARGT